MRRNAYRLHVSPHISCITSHQSSHHSDALKSHQSLHNSHASTLDALKNCMRFQIVMACNFVYCMRSHRIACTIAANRMQYSRRLAWFSHSPTAVVAQHDFGAVIEGCVDDFFMRPQASSSLGSNATHRMCRTRPRAGTRHSASARDRGSCGKRYLNGRRRRPPLC